MDIPNENLYQNSTKFYKQLLLLSEYLLNGISIELWSIYYLIC